MPNLNTQIELHRFNTGFRKLFIGLGYTLKNNLIKSDVTSKAFYIAYLFAMPQS